MLGKPVIRGTRIPVELFLQKLSEGARVEDLLDAYPRLTRDDVLAAMGFAADTLLVTEDKDFGRLVFAADKETNGVLGIRFPSKARGELRRSVQDLLKAHGERLFGRFTVLQPGRVPMR